MRRLMVAGLVGVAAMALVAGSWAQDIPWQTGKSAATSTGAPAVTSTGAAAVTSTDAPAKGDPAGAATTDTTAAVPLAKDPKFAKAVKPIEDQIAVVAKLQDLYDKEMTKPEKQRNLQLLTGYKTNIAQGFLKGSAAAKMAESQFAKPDDKKQIADAYEKPLREKSISTYLEIAEDSVTRKDYRDAQAIYKMILQIDPGNQAALDGLKKIEDLLKQPATTGTSGPNGGGLSTDPQHPWQPQQPWQQLPGYQKTWKTW